MRARDWRNKRVSRRLLCEKTLIWGFASFCLLGVALFFDASFWNCRLNDEAVERASTRVSTIFDGNESSFRDLTPIRTRSELNRRLADSALDYWNAYAASNSNVARTLAVGLSRWGVDQETLERVGNATGVTDELFNAEYMDGADVSNFASDSCAARDAINVLENWDDDSNDLDDALNFLRELDGDESGGEATYGDAILWTFNAEEGDPADYAGFVSCEDFEPIAIVETARRASDASSRLFFLLTLGGIFFSRRESILSDAFGIRRAVREIDAFMELWNVAGSLIFKALRASRRLFSLIVGWFFAGSSRRRARTVSFLPSSSSLSLFATVRLNN